MTPAGSTDATAGPCGRRGGPLHSSIIEENLGGGRLRVIDSKLGRRPSACSAASSPRWSGADAKGGGIIKCGASARGAPRRPPPRLGDGSFIRAPAPRASTASPARRPCRSCRGAAVGGEGPYRGRLVDAQQLRAVPGGRHRAAVGSGRAAVRGDPRRSPRSSTPARRPTVRPWWSTRSPSATPADRGRSPRLRSTAYATKGLRTVTALIGAPRTVKRGARVALRANGDRAERRRGRRTGGHLRRPGASREALDTGPSSTLAADGSCTVRVRLTRTGIVRVNFAGATGWKASVSRARNIRVR